jgi:hypothetical protein
VRELALLPPAKRALLCALSGMPDQGVPQQLSLNLASHTHNTAAFSPPLAHNPCSSLYPYDDSSTSSSSALTVLDLSIKSEPADPDLLDCESKPRKNCVHKHGSPDDARQKAKEKSKQYRQKQKIHRMTDATYDMIFRHQVAERKRRQRMREKINKLKVYGTGVYNVNVSK